MTQATRIGFACKYVPFAANSMDEIERHPERQRYQQLNTCTTTVRHLSSLDKYARFDRLDELCSHNMEATASVFKLLAKEPETLRMMRMSSELFPLYTHECAQDSYKSQHFKTNYGDTLALLGQYARKHGIRLSFHPGQFTILVSANPGVAENGAREFEYHARIAEMMGYTDWHADGLAINIHAGSGKIDLRDLVKAIGKLSETARNLITIENDEFNWNISEFSELGKHCALVLDVHHYWINTGYRASPYNEWVALAEESWRGVRPKIHLAMSPMSTIPSKYRNQKLPLQELMDMGITRKDLRVHSFAPWHPPSLEYVSYYLDRFDVMWEGKNKNLGARQIAEVLELI